MGIFSDTIKKSSATSTTSTSSANSNSVNKTPVLKGDAAAKILGVATALAGDTTKKTTKSTASKAATAGTASTASTAASVSSSDMVTWSGRGGISFFVNPTVIQGFKELTFKASVDSEDKENGGEKYASKKNSGAIAVTIKAELNAYVGSDVQEMAMNALDAARTGEQGYLYSYGKKLFGNQFMLTDAQVSKVNMNGFGKWVSCELQLTLKQCSKGDGSSASNNTSNKKSNKSTDKVTKDNGTNTGTDKSTDSIKAVNATNSAKKQSQQVLNNSNRNSP